MCAENSPLTQRVGSPLLRGDALVQLYNSFGSANFVSCSGPFVCVKRITTFCSCVLFIVESTVPQCSATGYSPATMNHNYTKSMMIGLAIAFMILPLVFVLLRLWAKRLAKRIGWDDYLTIAALVSG